MKVKLSSRSYSDVGHKVHTMMKVIESGRSCNQEGHPFMKVTLYHESHTNMKVIYNHEGHPFMEVMKVMKSRRSYRRNRDNIIKRQKS